MAAWIPSPNFYPGRRRPLAFIVWHSTESSEKTGAALSIARNWFGVKSSKVSAHLVVDDRDVVECVKAGDTAWHCANGNADGYGVEIVGRAGQTEPQWEDDYSLAAIRNACGWLRIHPKLAHIPARWLDDDQLRRRERGHTTHVQVARVLGGTTHTDPGRNFPSDYVMRQMGAKPAVVTADGPDSLPTIREGDTGDAVYRWQHWLNRMFPSYARIDLGPRRYGPQTVAATAEFQRRCGITGPDADGRVVGNRTNRAAWSIGYRG